MKRELILFLSVLGLLALMSLSLFDDSQSKIRKGRPRDLPLELAGASFGDPVFGLYAQGQRRDLLRKPTADTELAPLALDNPPLPALAAILPPPMPDSGADFWSEHLYLTPAKPVGSLDELLDTSAFVDDESELAAAELSGDLQGAFDTADDYSKTWDSVRINEMTTLWGRIVNANRYELGPGQELRFVQVNPQTGSDANFGERALSPGQYESYAFAETLRNQIEMRMVSLRKSGAGDTVDLRKAVREFLQEGLIEPVALSYATELATLAMELGPNDIQNALTYGMVLEEQFVFDEAFQHYEKLLQGQFAKYPAPRVAIARILRRFGLNDEAEEQLRIAVASLSTDAESLAALGGLLLDTARVEDAIPMLERADKLFARRDSPAALEAGLALGRAYLSRGNWAKAEALYSASLRTMKAVQADEVILASCGVTATAYLSGDFEKAATLANEAVAEFGSDAKLLYLRGITQAAIAGPAAEVIRDLRAATSGAPLDAAPAQSALAFWLDVLGESTDAQIALDAALELNPTLPYARYLQSRWAARDGDIDTARAGLREFVSEYPDCSAALAELAVLLGDSGSFDAAEVALARAEAGLPSWVQKEASAPQWANIVLRRGLNENARRNYEASQACFARAVSLDDSLYAARNATAITLYALGDLPAALAEWGYLQDLLRANEKHRQAVYAKLWQGRAEAHARLRRWVDSFDGDRFRPGWDSQSQARLGVEPRVREGALLIKGDHSNAGQTRAFRQTKALSFRQFSGELTVGAKHLGNAGLFISLANRRAETWYFRFYRDRDGALNWAWKQGAKEDSQRLQRSLPADTPVLVSFSLDREVLPPVLTVHSDGAVVWQGPVPALRSSSGNVSMGVYAETGNALPVDVRLDSVEMIHSQL